MRARRDPYAIQVLQENPNYNSELVMGYESAGYVFAFGREFAIPFTPVKNVEPQYIIVDEKTGLKYTNPLKTFCDILNRDEFVSGNQYEICVNILEHFIQECGGKEVLYQKASELVPKEILDANWDDLQGFYDYK